MKKTEQLVVCVRNRNYTASLELRKIYAMLPDKKAEDRNLMRVVDESGDDYLYPAGYFMPIRLPQSVERAVRRAS